ncbi:hypothetical protein Tco_1130818 [Tanacetum coccineum]
MEGHSYARRLSKDEYQLVEDLTKRNVKPRDILSIIKAQNKDNVHKGLSRIKRFNAQEAVDYRLINLSVWPPRIKADAPRKEARIGLG